MNISPGLVAKAAAGTAAVAASSAGIAYRDEISTILLGEDVGPLNKKLENLGLPETCRFERGKIEKDCGKLTEDVLKAIKFEGKSSTDELTITGVTENDKLKIRRDGDNDAFPDGIKIIFEASSAVTISGGGLNIDWKFGTNPEYKIKEEGAAIESAWTLEKLIKKINLSVDSSDSNKCNFGSTINVFEGVDKYTIGAKIKDNANNSKKLSCAKDSPGYNQGILLGVAVETSIELDNSGTSQKGNLDKIEKSGSESTTYQIKEYYMDGIKHWFLSKK